MPLFHNKYTLMRQTDEIWHADAVVMLSYMTIWLNTWWNLPDTEVILRDQAEGYCCTGWNYIAGPYELPWSDMNSWCKSLRIDKWDQWDDISRVCGLADWCKLGWKVQLRQYGPGQKMWASEGMNPKKILIDNWPHLVAPHTIVTHVLWHHTLYITSCILWTLHMFQDDLGNGTGLQNPHGSKVWVVMGMGMDSPTCEQKSMPKMCQKCEVLSELWSNCALGVFWP